MSTTRDALYPNPAAPYPDNDESLDARHMPGHYLAYGRHAPWCAIDDTNGVAVDTDEDHGDGHPSRCESLGAHLPEVHDDQGRLYVGRLCLATGYTHGFYPSPQRAGIRDHRVRFDLARVLDDAVEERTVLNLSSSAARSVAAALVALADKAEGLDTL